MSRHRLLVLLGVFGLLVVTATPIHAVPQRLRAFGNRLIGRSEAVDEALLGSTPADGGATETTKDLPLEPLRRGSARRRVGVAATNDDDPEDSATADTDVLSIARERPGKAPTHTAVPVRTEQLLLSGDITYKLPATAMLREGAPHRTRSRANDAVVESLTRYSTSSRSTRKSPASRAAPR